MKGIIRILGCGVLILFASCIKNNPDPSWIEVNAWVLESNSNNDEGELTSNFTDAKIFVNEKSIGIFQLPCKVPVLVSGNAVIRIFPVILNNGISATKKIYPFMEPYVVSVDLVQNETATINPKTKYFTTTVFDVKDFESGNDLISSSNSMTNIITESDGSNTYGRVLLTESENFWSCYAQHNSDIPYQFPLGSDVYLEVDYYNTNKIVTGLITQKTDGSITEYPNIAMNPQQEGSVVWKKIYIDLQEIVANSGAINFYPSFSATLDEGLSQGLIRIDNIKVVHN